MFAKIFIPNIIKIIRYKEVFIINELFKASIVPLVLLFVCVLSYGLLIPWLGFYWDDWPKVWVFHSLGTSGLLEYFSGFRPFVGMLHTLTTPLLGEAPLHWHLLALLIRWLGAVAIWWSLRGLWPQRLPEAASIAFLFSVYPGFTHQPVSFLVGQEQFLSLALFIFSLGAVIWSLRVPRLFWPFTTLALISSALSMLATEYFIGLEFLRPIFIWLVLSEKIKNPRQRVRSTLTYWSSYVVVSAIFVIWRLFLFGTTFIHVPKLL